MSVQPLALTRREYERYQEQLRDLRDRRAVELREQLREVRTYVSSDASEEMQQILEDQAYTEARITELEDLLRTAVVVDDDEAGDVVRVGSAVELEWLSTGRRATYHLSGTGGNGTNSISARSPVGAMLLGRRVDDVATVTLPNGRSERLRVLSVSNAV
jgi:transcription elongation factor GreA